MAKDLAYYLNLPYTTELIPEPGGGWYVGIRELPGCMTEVDSPEEALAEIGQLQREWLEIALEEGHPIPEPQDEQEFSGKFNLRVPKSLHRKLSEAAEREGVSLNQFCSTALGEAVGGARPAKSPSAGGDEFAGLRKGLRRLDALEDFTKDAGEPLEQGFARWLGCELDETMRDFRDGEKVLALGSLHHLVRNLQKVGEHSPLLALMTRLLTQLYQMLAQKEQMHQAQEVINSDTLEWVIADTNRRRNQFIEADERNIEPGNKEYLRAIQIGVRESLDIGYPTVSRSNQLRGR
jgi:antitoxin HicB